MAYTYTCTCNSTGCSCNVQGSTISLANISVGGIIKASDYNNLFSGLQKEAKRRSRSLSFTNSVPGKVVYASDYNQMTKASFLSVSSVSIGDIISASKLNSIISNLKTASGQCTCNCNGYCSCNSRYCSCNCNYCSCNGHY